MVGKTFVKFCQPIAKQWPKSANPTLNRSPHLSQCRVHNPWPELPTIYACAAMAPQSTIGLYTLIDKFQLGATHMALVYDGQPARRTRAPSLTSHTYMYLGRPCFTPRAQLSPSVPYPSLADFALAGQRALVSYRSHLSLIGQSKLLPPGVTA